MQDQEILANKVVGSPWRTKM